MQNDILECYFSKSFLIAKITSPNDNCSDKFRTLLVPKGHFSEKSLLRFIFEWILFRNIVLVFKKKWRSEKERFNTVDEYYQSSSRSNKVGVMNQILDIVCLLANFHPSSLDFIRQLQRWIGGIEWWKWLIKCQLARDIDHITLPGWNGCQWLTWSFFWKRSHQRSFGELRLPYLGIWTSQKKSNNWRH